MTKFIYYSLLLINCQTTPNIVDIISEPLLVNPNISAANKCPDDMVEIKGKYCPIVEQNCLQYRDEIVPANQHKICLTFQSPTKCLSVIRQEKHFCIDRYHYPNQAGSLATVYVSWYQAKQMCANLQKRLCTVSEYEFACEGEQMKPYPYLDGFHRDNSVCNIDRTPWLDPETHSFAELDKRVPAGSLPNCRSDFGVYDIVGDTDHWVVSEGNTPYISVLKGGHAIKGARNRCRPSTIVHGPNFSYYEIGFRCCKSISHEKSYEN